MQKSIADLQNKYRRTSKNIFLSKNAKGRKMGAIADSISDISRGFYHEHEELRCGITSKVINPKVEAAPYQKGARYEDITKYISNISEDGDIDYQNMIERINKSFEEIYGEIEKNVGKPNTVADRNLSFIVQPAENAIFEKINPILGAPNKEEVMMVAEQTIKGLWNGIIAQKPKENVDIYSKDSAYEVDADEVIARRRLALAELMQQHSKIGEYTRETINNPPKVELEQDGRSK
jgi:hypothetical protein